MTLGEVSVAGSVDSVLSGMLSPLLHVGQGTAGESPLGEVDAAQVQLLWGVQQCCGTSEPHLSGDRQADFMGHPPARPR